jgi:hypothetical protein
MMLMPQLGVPSDSWYRLSEFKTLDHESSTVVLKSVVIMVNL